jgi:hypothetical protein
MVFESILTIKYIIKKNKTDCPKGMQFFLAQVEQGKEIVCAYLRASAVN